MSLIKNLVKEPTKEKNPKKSDGADNEDDDEKQPLRPFIKSATDLQRLKLEKLMKNPTKLVQIPEQRREKDYMQSVPTFVRNVMGSSAGAGSGEFHVYRHLRRKEYARQKIIHARSTREQADEEFQKKLEANRNAADEKTAKKRAKRLKKKQRAKRPRQTQQQDNTGADKDETDTSESEKDAEAETTESGNPEAKDEQDVEMNELKATSPDGDTMEEASNATETTKDALSDDGVQKGEAAPTLGPEICPTADESKAETEVEHVDPQKVAECETQNAASTEAASKSEDAVEVTAVEVAPEATTDGDSKDDNSTTDDAANQ